MIYLTGDTHGDLEMRRLNTTNCPAKEGDKVIILGDFGICWDDGASDMWWRRWLNEKPFVTLFVDGNHDNHELLARLPQIELFGSKVGVLSDQVYHLKRGNIYTIEGKTFLTFGGATSIDKAMRKEHISWWKEEVPSYAEHDNAIRNLEKAGNKVDYILAHTCPDWLAEHYLKSRTIPGTTMFRLNDPTEKMLTDLCERADFKEFYFGHWHEHLNFGRFKMLYQQIIKLGE